VQSMRRRCTAVLNAAGGHTRYWLTFDFEPPFVQGHIIKFLLVTCLCNLFSLCLSCWIFLCSFKYLHMLSLLKINAVDSERTFLFLLSLGKVFLNTQIYPHKDMTVIYGPCGTWMWHIPVLKCTFLSCSLSEWPWKYLRVHWP
jgi:hypothetical protein